MWLIMRVKGVNYTFFMIKLSIIQSLQCVNHTTVLTTLMSAAVPSVRSLLIDRCDGNLILSLCFEPFVYSELSLHQRSKERAPRVVTNYTRTEDSHSESVRKMCWESNQSMHKTKHCVCWECNHSAALPVMCRKRTD